LNTAIGIPNGVSDTDQIPRGFFEYATSRYCLAKSERRFDKALTNMLPLQRQIASITASLLAALFSPQFANATAPLASPTEPSKKDPIESLTTEAYLGSIKAMIQLGEMHCKGEGVLKDELEGLTWFETIRKIELEVNSSDDMHKRFSSYYKDIPDEILGKARDSATQRLESLQEKGMGLSTPATTTLAGLKLIRSEKKQDNIRGLALLYTAAHRSKTEVEFTMPPITTALIQQTEAKLGKGGAIEAQQLAGLLATIPSGLSLGWWDDPKWQNSYVAVWGVFDPDFSKSEEKRLSEERDRDAVSIDEALRSVGATSTPVFPKQKSFFEKASDLLWGSN